MYWKHLDDLGLDKGGFLKPAPGEKAPKLSNDAGDHLVGIGILVVVLAIPAIIIWGVVRGLSGDSDDDAPGPQRVSDAQCEVWRIEGLGDGSTGTDPGDSLAKYEANNCG